VGALGPDVAICTRLSGVVVGEVKWTGLRIRFADLVVTSAVLTSAACRLRSGRRPSQTASVDGEDLLTPVVMRAVESILTRKGGQ